MDGTETRTRRGEDGPPDPGEVYYMVGPFGPLDRVFARCLLGIVAVAGLGSVWALWSIAVGLGEIAQILRAKLH